MTRSKATAIGMIAILLWSLLALFTVGSAPVPPLMLNAITFGIGGTAGLIWLLVSGGFGQLRGVGWKVYAFGTIGLFGYHLLYFSALRLAPAAEAGLICYLWPLLIVIFSGLMPGERLTWLHVAGAVMSFAGTGLLILGKGAALGQGGALTGYVLAVFAAFTWAGYSVLSRRLGKVPTASVAVFCLLTSVLSGLTHLGLTHLGLEPTLWPLGAGGWLSCLALGLGPVGLAFYVWDIGVKQGDIQLLGVASYAAPLLSTLALVLAGVSEGSARIGLGAFFIAAGAGLAAWASARPRRV